MFNQSIFLIISILFITVSAQAKSCQIVDISTHLGTLTQLNFAQNAGSKITIDPSSLKDQDPFDLIKVETLQKNINEFEVFLSIPYSAPSFENLEIIINEQGVLDNQLLNQWCLIVSVEPLIEITVGTSVDWTYESAFSTPEEIYLQPHVKPVQVRFVSSGLTGLNHRIHGEGAVKHAPTDSTLREAGDTYQFEMNQLEETKGSYYCHNNQSSMDRRWIYFNVMNIELLRLQ